MKTANRSRPPRAKPQPRHSRNGAPTGQRLELGEYIVADPLICHGQPTFKGTRIMVWQILDELAHGMSPAQIVKAWGGRITKPAVLEAIGLAGQVFAAPRKPLLGSLKVARLPALKLKLHHTQRSGLDRSASPSHNLKKYVAGPMAA